MIYKRSRRLGIECEKCGVMNPSIEKYCLSCGEKLNRDNVRESSPNDVEGSSWAAMLSVFLVIFGAILFIFNLVYLINVEGYNIWYFLLGLAFIALYFVFYGALIELLDNVALTKSYMKKNHDYLKKIAEKDEN